MSNRRADPIIDMHMHAFIPSTIDGGLPAPCVPDSYEDRSGLKSAKSSEECLARTLEQMERFNVVQGFLSGGLSAVHEWMGSASDRFIPSPTITFNALEYFPPDPDLEDLRREYASGQLRGMGEIGTQYMGFAPNDAALEPYFALAEEFDLPTLIHTLGFGAPLSGFRSSAGRPLLLEDVLVRHPRLRLYVENAGFPFFGEIVAMMYQYPQLYADLSTITWICPREAFHDYLERLVRAGLGKRLMFGSDQMRWPEKIGDAIDAIESADFLTEEQRRDIFYNNAAHFLRL